MTAYYNDSDAAACDWLEELIRRDLIAPGIVDRRSILDVTPADLGGFTQCHFFAGIGGWSYALRMAGWPDDRPVWTGSPPCQPFSAAGKQLGKDDERHLAPHFAGLVSACRPPILFGEQVASAAVLGRAARKAEHGTGGAAEWAWLDDLFDRLEAASYSCAAADIPAAGIGAPHIRQRLFFGAVRIEGVDNTPSARHVGAIKGTEGHSWEQARVRLPSEGGGISRLGDASGPRLEGHAGDGDDRHEPGRQRTDEARPASSAGAIGRMADADSRQRSRVSNSQGRQPDRQEAGREQGDCEPQCDSTGCRVADADSIRRQRRRASQESYEPSSLERPDGLCDVGGVADADSTGPQPRGEAAAPAGYRHPVDANGGANRAATLDNFWSSADWLYCRDGKWRPVEPGTFPLANGVSARLVRLRGYGNAIVPQAAAAFVTAFMKSLEITT